MRPGAAVLYLVEHSLDAGVHQQIRRVAGVVRERLDGHKVAALDGQDRLEGAVEVTPVDRVGCGGQVVKHYLTSCSMNARQTPYSLMSRAPVAPMPSHTKPLTFSPSASSTRPIASGAG